MEIEENVYEEELLTGQAAEAEKEVSPTVLGKFKDVDALAKAYASLQAEFTRRSQRLKELEAKKDNLQERKAEDGAEKLRKNAVARKEREREFDQFVSDLEKGDSTTGRPDEDAKKPSEGEGMQPSTVGEGLGEKEDVAATGEIADVETPKKGENGADGDEKGGTFVEKYHRILSDRKQEMDADALYLQASNNEEVRLKIVGDYLKSLSGMGVPLAKGGAGRLAAPPVRAKTVAEAGNLALMHLKKGSV